MLGDLTGKTALVTGAGSGIGAGIAAVMAKQGASVAIADRNEEWAAGVAEEIGGSAMTVPLDVTDRASVESAVEGVISEWGVLDILVNNAGVAGAPGYSLEGEREEDWDVTYAINVKGVNFCCNAVVPHMKERRYGKIISIASMGGHAPRLMGGAYAASKAAVLRYTKGLAYELASFNINVNVICPRRRVDQIPGGRRYRQADGGPVPGRPRPGADIPRQVRVGRPPRAATDAGGHRQDGGLPGLRGRLQRHRPVRPRRRRSHHKGLTWCSAAPVTGARSGRNLPRSRRVWATLPVALGLWAG